MNRHVNGARRSVGRVIVAASAVALGLPAGPALAGQSWSDRSVVIHTHDLDLRSDSGAAALYARIADAAEQVCARAGVFDMRTRMERQQCAHRLTNAYGHVARTRITVARRRGVYAVGRTPMPQQIAGR